VTKEELYLSLDYIDATRRKRMDMARLVTANPKLVEPLLQIAFDIDNPVSSKACWILEYVVKANPEYIFPFLDSFSKNLHKLILDSSVRPMAKICEVLIKDYFSNTSNNVQTSLTNEHLELIATCCFAWLIGDHKVAAKAYSMTSLLLLGRKFNWIHPELRMVLEANYAKGSAAYKARARITLDKLK